MTATMFKKATRTRSFLKIALTGPSGSGKTYSALCLAFGLGEKVAVLDTENGSASLYNQLGNYDTCEVAAPYEVKKYLEVINGAAAAGYDVLIIDSLSHAWAGEGGLLQKKEALDTRGGNQYSNWASVTKEHEALKAAILQSPIHIIVTMRSKQEYVINEKNKPVKVGMAPVQRDGMEYEFSVVFDLGMDHMAAISKDRTGLFDGTLERITPAHGKRLAAWRSEASESPEAPKTSEVTQSAPLRMVNSEPPTEETLDPEALKAAVTRARFAWKHAELVPTLEAFARLLNRNQSQILVADDGSIPFKGNVRTLAEAKRLERYAAEGGAVIIPAKTENQETITV